MWLFWPPSDNNLSLFSKTKDRSQFTSQDIGKLEGGFFNCVANSGDFPAAFLIPPYHIFTSIALRSGAYITRLVFAHDTTFARTLFWMRKEMEMLRDGWALAESEDKMQDIERFKEVLVSLKGGPYPADGKVYGKEAPCGFVSFVDGLISDLDKIAAEPMDPLVALYMNSELAL